MLNFKEQDDVGLFSTWRTHSLNFRVLNSQVSSSQNVCVVIRNSNRLSQKKEIVKMVVVYSRGGSDSGRRGGAKSSCSPESKSSIHKLLNLQMNPQILNLFNTFLHTLVFQGQRDTYIL